MLVKVCFISIFVLIQAWMLGVCADDQLIRRREVMIIDDAAGVASAVIQENKFPLSRQAATTKFNSEDEELFGLTRVETTRHLQEGKGGKGGAAGKGGKGDDDGKGGKGGSKGGSKGGEDAGKGGKGGSKGGAKGGSKGKGKGKIKEKRQKIAKRTPQVRIKSKLPQPTGSE